MSVEILFPLSTVSDGNNFPKMLMVHTYIHIGSYSNLNVCPVTMLYYYNATVKYTLPERSYLIILSFHVHFKYMNNIQTELPLALYVYYKQLIQLIKKHLFSLLNRKKTKHRINFHSAGEKICKLHVFITTATLLNKRRHKTKL